MKTPKKPKAKPLSHREEVAKITKANRDYLAKLDDLKPTSKGRAGCIMFAPSLGNHTPDFQSKSVPGSNSSHGRMHCDYCSAIIEYSQSEEGKRILCPHCGRDVCLMYHYHPQPSASLVKHEPPQEDLKKMNRGNALPEWTPSVNPQISVNENPVTQDDNSAAVKFVEFIGGLGFLLFVGGIAAAVYYFHFYSVANPGSEYVNLERLNTRQGGIIIGVTGCLVGLSVSLVCLFLLVMRNATRENQR